MTLHHRRLLQTRADRLLRWAGFLVWGALTLDLLELRVPAAAAVRRVLTAQLAVGELHVSLGDFAAFGFTVWLAFLVSRFVRFVLEEDVYSHLHLERGMPYAVSTLLHYAVLVLGFIFAVAALGVDLNRFAILAGAFGVGIGFGLQNVVNNFVSGLILLFERPIQIGDTVQLGELLGEVKRIGIRASVVRTWDGAEVVVPNGKLISEQLTNWTLSDRHRRIDVSVGVAYGSDPEQVLALLLQVAAAHPEVLSEPAPQALFLGFGDSALDFVLRGWTAQFENAVRIRSELTVAVSRALAEAGIEVPFPQRDLHVKSLDAEVGSLLVQGRPSRA
jgi:small-conductance mechanosensitive channel